MVARATSIKPAATKRYRVTFVGPKGGYHHLPFTFKLNQMISDEDILNTPRSQAIMAKMKADGWIVHTIEWYNSKQELSGVHRMIPNAILIYRLHKNDVYNSRATKPGWKIVGAY